MLGLCMMHVCMQKCWQQHLASCMYCAPLVMQKNWLHFSICVCHPCAGAMIIFSVSFQFSGPDCHPEIVSQGKAEPIWDIVWPSACSMQDATLKFEVYICMMHAATWKLEVYICMPACQTNMEVPTRFSGSVSALGSDWILFELRSWMSGLCMMHDATWKFEVYICMSACQTNVEVPTRFSGSVSALESH